MVGREKKELKLLIYCSKPTTFSKETLAEILDVSQKNNLLSGLTGALISRSDLYFQYLEGPVSAVDTTFDKIKLDSRHCDIKKIKEDITDRRLFASWAMRDDPVKTYMWTRQQVAEGLLTKLTPDDAFHAFERLSREVDQFDQQL